MAVKLRLARGGSKKAPFYRVVAANADAPRDGKFLEKLGTYDPMLDSKDENRVVLDSERVKYWLSVGAKPTERVEKFLIKAKLVKEKAAKKITKKESALAKAKAASDATKTEVEKKAK